MLNELCRYFICFMVFGFIGWCYESLFYSVQLKKPVNSGFLKGCLCPIYGFGGMLLMPVAAMNADYKVIFISGMIICSVLEYFISWLFERLFGARWWDYSDWPLNINGRICAVSILGFGIASLIGTQIIIPAVYGYVSAMPPFRLYTVSAFIMLLLITDIALTLKSMDPGKKMPWFVEEHSKLIEKHKGEIGDKIRKFIRRS